MNTLKPTRSGSRRGTALALAVAMILCAVPAFAAPPSQDRDPEFLPQKVFSFDWSFLELLGEVFFGAREPVQSVQESSGMYHDPDGQSLTVTDSARIAVVSPVEREIER